MWEGNTRLTQQTRVDVAHKIVLTSRRASATDSAGGSSSGWQGPRSEPALDVKYSPDGSLLAVGGRDCFIHIYDVAAGYTLLGQCSGHRAQVMHLDWSENSAQLRSNDGLHQLLYWNARKCTQLTSAFRMRNTRWATTNCVLGWALQGVWRDTVDDTAVVAVARSHGGNTVLASDDCNNVRMFRYPCLVGADYDTAHGHMCQVKRIRWMHDDRRVVTIAGVDPCIFQWRHVTSTGETVA